MISGIVNFSEVVQKVKQLIGLTNVDPYLPKIRQSFLDAENDIGNGTLMIRKEKAYQIGDSDYDGIRIKLPIDFTGEYFYEKLTTAYLDGQYLRLYTTPGPADITLTYVGWTLDDDGNPFTNRNRFEAVVQRVINDIYTTKVFLGQGSARTLQAWKMDYDNLVMAARGNDVMPTDEEWSKIGRTLASDRYALLENDLPEIEPSTETISAPPSYSLTVDMVAVFEANLI